MGLYPVCSGGSRAVNGKISPQRHDYKAIKTVRRANVAFFNCNRDSLKKKMPDGELATLSKYGALRVR